MKITLRGDEEMADFNRDGERPARATDRECQGEVTRTVIGRPSLTLCTQPLSFFQLPLPPSAAFTPPTAAPLTLPGFLRLSPPPQSAARAHFAFRDERRPRGTHGDAGFSVTMVSLANRNGAKIWRCMCARVCMGACVWVWA